MYSNYLNRPVYHTVEASSLLLSVNLDILIERQRILKYVTLYTLIKTTD
jgi:hypothetical protein